jgi:two-component system chemotaxis response regulator CheB
MATSTISPASPNTAAGRPATAHVVVIAASAGGIDALRTVLGGLPDGFPAPVVIVLHRTPGRESLFASIFKRDSALPVKDAVEGEIIAPGMIYLAPADHHLTLDRDGRMVFSEKLKISYGRAAADPLFESAAEAYGSRAVGVVLSGGGRSGATGAKAIHDVGGKVLAQDQATSRHFSMPKAAIDAGAVTTILPITQIAEQLKQLIKPSEESENGLAADPEE